MNIFWWKKPTPGTGALVDTRPESEKQKDYSMVELVTSANPVNWVEKGEKNWRKFPVQDQNGSGSCVAQTMKKILGVLYWLKNGEFVKFSATHVYQRRANKPNAGMIGLDAFELARKGVTLEDLAPSERLTDAQMDNQVIEKHEEDVGKIFAIGGHVGIPNGDFETVASVIETTGKAVMVWFYFSSPEWSQFIPTLQTPFSGAYDPKALRHSVAAVDFTLYKGKKYLIIEDSAHFGGLSRRLISEEFFAARNFFNRYPMNFTFSGGSEPVEPSKPKYTFGKTLVFIPLTSEGEIFDPVKNAAQKDDVVALQNILKYEGLFPTNVESTGYYGAVTAKAVLAFQKKHAVAPDAELDPLGGRSAGPKTVAKLNDLYGV